MIEIPMNKALVAAETEIASMCKGCYFEDDSVTKKHSPCRDLECSGGNRKDGKNVIFKLVDYQPDLFERVIEIVNELKGNDPPLAKEEVDALISRLWNTGVSGEVRN